MKFGVKSVSALVAAAFLMGAMAATPANAGDKRKCSLVCEIDHMLTRLDKDLFGWLRKDHKR